MEKPTVFLSHSSLDKAPLATLKSLLDARAAGSLNFFLSSDGESIRFGRNWVVRISDALSEAKLMFLFLSPQSADSKWIHFEAGCAYAKGIQVVPVCLPGIDLNQIKPPLSLLQGFNLHSHEAMSNLARICNETFDMKIQEVFSHSDFETVVRNILGRGNEFFGEQTWAIEAIHLNSEADVPSNEFNPMPTLHEICGQAGMNCHLAATGTIPQTLKVELEQPGCIIEFSNYEVHERVKSETHPLRTVGTGRRKYKLTSILSPELFQINARLLDQWIEKAHFPSPLNVSIEFNRQITAEKRRQDFTAKLHRGGIKIAEKGCYEFEGLTFSVAQYFPWKLEYQLDGKLDNKRLPEIVNRLFKSEVFWERQPEFSEMFANA